MIRLPYDQAFMTYFLLLHKQEQEITASRTKKFISYELVVKDLTL